MTIDAGVLIGNGGNGNGGDDDNDGGIKASLRSSLDGMELSIRLTSLGRPSDGFWIGSPADADAAKATKATK